MEQIAAAPSYRMMGRDNFRQVSKVKIINSTTQGNVSDCPCRHDSELHNTPGTYTQTDRRIYCQQPKQNEAEIIASEVHNAHATEPFACLLVLQRRTDTIPNEIHMLAVPKACAVTTSNNALRSHVNGKHSKSETKTNSLVAKLEEDDAAACIKLYTAPHNGTKSVFDEFPSYLSRTTVSLSAKSVTFKQLINT
jgi:hypothetical protein